MKKAWLVIASLLLCGHVLASGLPYNPKADARADVSRALEQARNARKDVLLVFGANWCPECRRMDTQIHDKQGKLGDDKYVIVKVDVGNFDKNLDLAHDYGNPIRKGISGAVILTSDNRTVYAGPLSHILEPERRLIKIAVFIAFVLAATAVMGAGIVIVKRKYFSRRES